jgi:hypothetical protein
MPLLQPNWTRRCLALELREAGWTLRAIGERLGVSRQRAGV